MENISCHDSIRFKGRKEQYMRKVAVRFAICASLLIILSVAILPGTALALDPPKWVAAIHIEAQGAIGLRWLPVPGATGYKVLRSTTSGSGYQEIAAPPAPQHFDAGIAPGNTYYYVLQSVAGAEASANSAEKSVAVTIKEVVKPNPPRWKAATVDGKAKAIRLEWQPVPGAVAYNLYRRESFKPAGKEDLIASLPGADPYLDKDKLKKNIEYIYLISVLDGSFVESDKSAPRKIKFTVKTEKKVTKKEEKIVANRRVEPLGKYKYVLQEGDVARGKVTPNVVTWHDGELYVGYNFGTIVVFDEKFNVKRKIGKRGTGKADFKTSMGVIAFDDDGNLHTLDKAANRMLSFTDTGEFLGAFSLENGKDPTVEEDKMAISATRFTVGPDGNFYVSDQGNHMVRVFSPKGELLRRIGRYGQKAGEFSMPINLEFTDDGRLVVLEAVNARVQILDQEMEHEMMFGEAGARVGQFSRPVSLVIDQEKGYIYIPDFVASVIHVWNLEGKIIGVIKYYDEDNEAGFNGPAGLTRSDEGVFYIIDGGTGEIRSFEDDNP